MIIVRFDGGLGNQMLQYASYLALQQRYPQTKIVADTRNFNIVNIHTGFELERLFPIELNIFFGKRSKTVNKIGRYWHFGIDRAYKFFYKAGFKKFKFIEDNGTFNEELFNLNENVNYYLNGQWGNQKYFENVKDSLHEHFVFKQPLDKINLERKTEIESVNSVGVHIRRGDYVSGNSNFVELSKSNYYPDAFEHISSHISNSVFYIFSDDAAWCMNNLTWLKKYKHYFITGNTGENSYKDMQLMSVCKHNIVANSTFSWWSAMLNKREERKTICPEKLFNNEVMNAKIISEFYPDSWIKM